MLRCNKCRKVKPHAEFYNNNKYTCIDCALVGSAAARAQKNPEYKAYGDTLSTASDVRKLMNSFTEIKREPEDYRNKQAKKQLVQDDFCYKWI